MKKFSIVFMLISLALLSCADKVEVEKTDKKVVEFESLSELLENQKNEFAENAPREKIAAFEEGVNILKKSEITKKALKKGAEVPKFTALLSDGSEITSDSIFYKGTVVLIWYRGGWCPYCNIQLSVFNEYLKDFSELGATLYAISPEIPAYIDEMEQRNDLGFNILSDSNNDIARKFGIVYELPEIVKSNFNPNIDLLARNGTNSWELPLAVAYVINSEGIIHYSFIDFDYRRRAEPDEILMAVGELVKNKRKFH